MFIKITLLVLVYVLVGFYEVRQLVQKEQKKEIWVVCILLVFGLIFSIVLLYR